MKAPRLAPLPHGEGTLRWNAKRQCVELRHVLDGKRYTERDATRAGAITKRDQRRAKAQVESTGGHEPVRTVALRWHQFKHGGSVKAHAANERWAVDQIIVQLGDRSIAEVTTPEIMDTYQAWIDHPYGKQSMTRLRRVLGQVFEFAHLRGAIESTAAFTRAKMPAGATPRRRVQWLDEDEARRMVDVLVADGSTFAVLCLVMQTCGLRPGEATALAWDDVDLDAGVLHVRAALHRTNGGRSIERWHVDTHGDKALKTPQSQRALGISPMLAGALRRHRAAQAERRLEAAEWHDTDGLVFTTDDGLIIRHDGRLRSVVPEFCAMAEAKRITPNGFRHTFASMLLHVDRRSVTEVARAMGHKDTRQVIETYGHPMVDVVSTSGIYDTEVVA